MGKEEAAQGVVTVVTANMAKATRQILVARGLDPRDFTLMAFGGAGGMVVGDLLRASDVKRAVVPNNPGALCAVGMLVTDFRHDASATMVRSLDQADGSEVAAVFKDLENEALGRLVEEGVSKNDVVAERYIDVRYIGQEHYLKIPVRDSAPDFKRLGEAFNAEHERVFGYCTPEFPCEFVNLRVTALGQVQRPEFPTYEPRSASDGPLKADSKRAIYFDGKDIDTPIYRIESLRPGDSIIGPTVIEDPRSTVVILPGQAASVDTYRNILIEEIDG
jgi:N-methylhydantoinase A